MLKYIKLISALSFTLAGDTLFSVAVIWCVLSQGGTEKSLAFFLCLVTLITFAVQRLSGKFKKSLEKSPQKSFVIIRICGVICSAVLLLVSIRYHSLWFLYFSGMVFTIISFLSQLTAEAIMGQAVLDGQLSSNNASRILQTAMQIAAFLGAAMTGFVLNLGGITAVLIINAATYAAGILVFPALKKTISTEKFISRSKNEHKPEDKRVDQFNLWLAFLGLCFLMIQISAFNFLVPLIAQHEKAWDATQFGFIDAMAGMGAFVCTFLATESGWKKWLWLATIITIPLCDLAFHLLSNPYKVAIFATFLGFFGNLYRIKIREFIYDTVSNTKQILDWVSRITLMTVLMKSAIPLILAIMTLQPSLSFSYVGLLSGAGILMVTILGFKHLQKVKQVSLA